MVPDTSARGRPRSADRTEAILLAAHEILHEGGYDNFRMQDVADRAGAGLATIYRRWPAKPDLVAAAICHQPILEFELSGDPVADLRQGAIAIATEIGSKGEFIAGFIAAVRDHPVVADAMRSAVIGQSRALFRDTIARIVGSEPAWVDHVVDSIPGVLMFRSGMLGEVVDAEAFADDVVDMVEALAAAGRVA